MNRQPLVSASLDEIAQQVAIFMHRTAEAGMASYLTLAESEELIKDLSAMNAKLRVVIARDGDRGDKGSAG